MKKIKATIYRIDGTKEDIELNPKTSLETLQEIVGGYIEVITLYEMEDYLKGDFSKGNDLIINEEGLLFEFPINPWSQLVGLNTNWENEDFRGDIVLIQGKLP